MSSPHGKVRIELFVHSLPASLDFYTRVLRFNVGRHDTDETGEGGYAHVTRSSITLGLSAENASKYPLILQSPAARIAGRRPPCGTEIVLELPSLKDIHDELEHVHRVGWTVDAGMKLQAWGLWDFRIVDPDGFYWRITQESELAQG